MSILVQFFGFRLKDRKFRIKGGGIEFMVLKIIKGGKRPCNERFATFGV